MRIRPCALVAITIIVAAPPLTADPPAAPYSLLIDVPGYNHAGTVVVPMWPLVEWLDARVEDTGDVIVIRRGDRMACLQLPAAVWQGRMPIVPLRLVAEQVGAKVRYHGADSNIGAQLGHIPVVELEIAGKRSLVIVHAAPPPLVSDIIRSIDDEGFGRNWLLRVSAVSGDYVRTREPQWSEAEGFAAECVTGVLLHRHDEWLYLLRSPQSAYSAAELAEAGIPLDVAQQLGMELEER